MVTPIITHSYVADCSKKIRAVKRNSALQGKALGKMPYGYRTEVGRLELWIPDGEAADTVTEIFKLFTSGMGIADICRFLTAKNIPTPETHKNGKTAGTIWNVSSVCQMLEDSVYIGRYTSHKLTTSSYKNKKRIINPESEWVVIENHHPPLVDMETFETAQRLRGTRRRRTKHGEKSILSGLVRCADCGATLSYAVQGSNGEYPNFVCKTYRSTNVHNEHKCTRHGIGVADLELIVLTKIQQTVGMALVNEKLFTSVVHKSVNANAEKLIKSKTIELAKVEHRKKELDTIINRLYEDHVIGKLSEERFNKMLESYEKEQSTLTSSTNMLRTDIDDLKRKTANLQSFMQIARQYGKITELTEEAARAYIEKVVVHEAVFETGTKRKKVSQQVDVYLTYIGQFNIE